MALQPTPENFRAEIGRHFLDRKEVQEISLINAHTFRGYVNGWIPLTDIGAHNIGWAINHLTGVRVFGVDDSRPPEKPKRGRPRKFVDPGLGGEKYESLRELRRRIQTEAWKRRNNLT